MGMSHPTHKWVYLFFYAVSTWLAVIFFFSFLIGGWSLRVVSVLLILLPAMIL